jgi:hypothetical protein
MRASVMELLDSFAWDDAAVAAEAKRRFDGHWEDASVLPAEYKVRERQSEPPGCYLPWGSFSSPHMRLPY